MPCIEKSGALPSVPRRRWPTLTASCGQVQFSELRAQGRSVAAFLRTDFGGRERTSSWMARPRETSFSFTAVSWTDPAGKGLRHLEEGRLQRQGRADVLDAPHSPVSLVRDLDRGHSRGGRHPPHEHAHPARLPTPRRTLVTTSKPYRDSTIHSRRSVSLELSLETQFFREADRLSLRRADQAAIDLELFPRPHIRGAP